ncbi:OTU domain-containing protein, partial [Streptomyces broussonetiae]|uniref:OTU domain-containing protein n=1 Tax=Streptomyces broussonetiae TaxID=2686304 RepID=UPI0035E3B812
MERLLAHAQAHLDRLNEPRLPQTVHATTVPPVSRPLPPESVPQGVKPSGGPESSMGDASESLSPVKYWWPKEEQMATLARLGRELVWVPDDGNCFFHALTTVVHARFSPDELEKRAPKFPLPGSDDYVRQLRQGIADYVLSQDGWEEAGDYFASDAGFSDAAPDRSHMSEFHRDVVKKIVASGSWDGQFGDVVPYLIQRVFGDLGFGVVDFSDGQPVKLLSQGKDQLVLVEDKRGVKHYWATRDVQTTVQADSRPLPSKPASQPATTVQADSRRLPSKPASQPVTGSRSLPEPAPELPQTVEKADGLAQTDRTRLNARAGAAGVVGPRVPQRGGAPAGPSPAASQPVTGVTRQAGIEKPATRPEERVPAPARGAGVDPAALRDVDVVNSWLSVSTVAGRPRSEAVRPV